MPSLERTRAREVRGALVLALVLGPVAGCTGSTEAAAPAGELAVPVSVTPVEREPVERGVEASGTLFPDEEVTVSGKVGGRVSRVFADVGDVVSGEAVLACVEQEELDRGESIARLTLDGVLARLGTEDVPEAGFDLDHTALVVRARAQLENARAHLGRLADLSREGQGFVAEQDLRDAETAVASADAEALVERLSTRALVSEARLRAEELALAQLRRRDATIRAPGLGRWTVAARFWTEGELAAPGSPAFRLVACERVKLRVAIGQSVARALRPGLEARVTVAGWGERTFPGTVARVSPTIEPQSRTFGVEVVVPNVEGELRAGSFATARIVTATEEALLVPADAVQSSAGTERVFVLEGDRARERVVATGEHHGSRIEVRGLDPDARVVTRGQTVLADGALVRLVAARPAARVDADGRGEPSPAGKRAP